MVWKSADFQVPKTLVMAHSACLGAAERLGWKVAKDKKQKIRLSIPPSVHVRLGRVEIKLEDEGAITRVKAKASNMGDGPLARSRLGDHLRSLEEAIRIEAEAQASPG